MEIVRPGYDTSTLHRCDVCCCEFRYLPGEVETEEHLLYNVPEQYRDYNGGDAKACEVRHVRFVICPCCKTKCYIDKE